MHFVDMGMHAVHLVSFWKLVVLMNGPSFQGALHELHGFCHACMHACRGHGIECKRTHPARGGAFALYVSMCKVGRWSSLCTFVNKGGGACIMHIMLSEWFLEACSAHARAKLLVHSCFLSWPV